MIHKNHAKEFLAQVNNIMEIDAANEHEAEEIRLREKKYLADVSQSPLSIGQLP
jgi:hypothetical protein